MLSYILYTNIENYIDGANLMQLIDGFQEFQQLVPQAQLRMKLKNTHSKCICQTYKMI